MLRYFRINDPYRLVGLLVISFLIYLPFFIDTIPLGLPELKSLLIGEKIREGAVPYADLVDATPPLTCWTYALLDWVFGQSLLARHILAYLFIFFMSAYLGMAFIDKKIFGENTYVPSLLFLVLHAFSFDTIVLSGELLGSAFVLFALTSLFREIEFRSQRIETVLNIGLYVGVASLFSFAYILFLPAVCLIVMLYARRDLKSFWLLLTGFCLPHALLVSLYFLFGNADALWSFYYAPNLAFTATRFISLNSLLVLGSVPLFYLAVSLVMLNREARFTRYQTQVFQIMFLWIVFSTLQVFYAKNFRPQSLIVLIPTFAYFITHFLLFIRRRRYAEMNLWAIVLGVVSISLLARYGYLVPVSYDALVVRESAEAKRFSGKKILVLQDEPAYFINNKPATPFLQWELAAEIFKNPDYYENVLKVSEDLVNDPPEVIVDPDQYMKPFLDRIPALKKQYRAADPGVYYRTSN